MRRSSAGLLDLGMALTAGAAAGYILPRRTTSGALPGVGIAVALEGFQLTTGIPVRYVGSEDFVSDLLARSNDDRTKPDVAVVPQPGTAAQLAAQEQILPLGQALTQIVYEDYDPAVIDLGRVDDLLEAVPYRLTIKRLVWYRPSVFEAKVWRSRRRSTTRRRSSRRSARTPTCPRGASASRTGARPAARHRQRVRAGPSAAAIWARQGGFLSPNAVVLESVYPDDHLARLAEALAAASEVAYDARIPQSG
jgi:hypothetical protein